MSIPIQIGQVNKSTGIHSNTAEFGEEKSLLCEVKIRICIFMD